MKFTKMRAAGIAAGVAVLALIGAPASAGSTSIADASGVDFDAACLLGNPLAPPATPNNVPSPGTNGACLIGTYDGSTESTDFDNVSMSSAASTNTPSNTKLTASFSVGAAIPAAGAGCNPQVGGAGCPDLPDRTFVGVGYKALFQNPARQNNTPTNSAGGGCPRVPTGTVFDQHEHWLDGYHFFIGFDAVWTGAGWTHSAQIGTYDPAPDGAFFFTELGTNDGGGWANTDPAAVKGTHWDVNDASIATGDVSVTVDGVLPSSDAVNCTTGIFNTVYAKAGDSIVNVKGLATADSTVTLPITIPLSLIPGFSDITSVGGFIFYSDITAGNSVNSGVVGNLLETLGLGIRENVSYTGGFLGISDTLGDSLACPTPTFGGLLPRNPFLNPAIGCQYDDDNIPVPNPATLPGLLANPPSAPWTAINPGERGTLLTEWWDTNFGFTA